MRQGFSFNPTTGELDLINLEGYEIFSTAPEAWEGRRYINSSDDKIYVYYGGSWQVLHTLVPGTASYLLLEDGSYLLLENGDKLILG